MLLIAFILSIDGPPINKYARVKPKKARKIIPTALVIRETTQSKLRLLNYVIYNNI